MRPLKKKFIFQLHPKKTEVKFEEEQNIYAILRSAVKHSLGVFQVLPTLDFGLLRFRDTVVRLKCEVSLLVSKYV